MPVLAWAQEVDETAKDAPAAIFVQTMIVPSEEAMVSRQFFGQVAALETVNISFEVGGYLATLEAQEGTMVKAGTLLASLDLAPFERAVERAELELAQATRDFKRAQELASRNVSSEVRAQDTATARDLADVALREARDALADAQIRAPFDGMVADRLGTSFTTIEPGQPILRLHNMSETRVEFDLPERLLAHIGDPAGVAFTGIIAGHDGAIPLEFREFRAETGRVGQSYTISLAAAPGMSLLPGRTILVRASLPAAGEGISLPTTAILTASDGAQFVVEVADAGDGPVARHVPVEVMSSNGTEFRVTGVAAASEIVAIGSHLIDDGQPVKRFTGLTVEGL
ncbi:efflux RND transporter periplasmic adaptor subunit [uncultured Hoeflea sp.]|uniref:efflux RND transporter periplasmic adaptor subunit n=1 Tax=uncultured Hoeflea sp. TaxID=538666 RepID=UPI00262534EB|nr:efflux RND transporter periplasmic adaptor subunit [uncultured Hoeflea sp.]